MPLTSGWFVIALRADLLTGDRCGESSVAGTSLQSKFSVDAAAFSLPKDLQLVLVAAHQAHVALYRLHVVTCHGTLCAVQLC